MAIRDYPFDNADKATDPTHMKSRIGESITDRPVNYFRQKRRKSNNDCATICISIKNNNKKYAEYADLIITKLLPTSGSQPTLNQKIKIQLIGEKATNAIVYSHTTMKQYIDACACAKEEVEMIAIFVSNCKTHEALAIFHDDDWYDKNECKKKLGRLKWLMETDSDMLYDWHPDLVRIFI